MTVAESKLQKEIDKTRTSIKTDGYSMSIGEWISIYERGELDIHPDFQRFFRWTNKQKSRLIESILLGIPIPPIFVAQRKDGIWDVVDGLQRLSTIFQFVGILKNEKGEVLPPLVLEPTNYLPSLKGLVWEDKDNPGKSLSSPQRLSIKRAKINVSIILSESGRNTKFELFQRLNTGGSLLSSQEMRNSLMVMLNPDLFKWFKRLVDNEDFQTCIGLTDRYKKERYDMELALRFIVFRRMDPDDLKDSGEVSEFLTEQVWELAKEDEFDRKEEKEAFERTFNLLAKSLGSNAFHKYDEEKGRFSGGFSISAYEAIAFGVSYNYSRLNGRLDAVADGVKQVWQNPVFKRNSGAGVHASTRLPKILPLGRRIFEK